MKKQECYSIEEISGWKSKDVRLPNVQRSFVWKPSQIENLWDSLLRGYPVGAIVLSQKPDKLEPNKEHSSSKPVPFELLDGQQRVTAIRLGFGTDTFRQSEKRFKVFIDLAPPSDSNLKYQFRVITSSHPWGYQRKDNTRPLDADNIRKAMKLYDIEDHLEFIDKLDNFFPYDAIYPIPFEYFVNAAVNQEDATELHKKIKSWGKNIKKQNTEITTSRIAEILYATKEMLKVKIPALYIDYSLLEPDSQEAHVSDDNKNSLEEADDVEKLFIRLNAGGTPLRGEELNNSILKARIDRDLQDRIEKSCLGLLAPSRFITIAYRLYQHHTKDETNDTISMRIKPKQFQKTMSKDEKSFKNFCGIFLKQISSITKPCLNMQNIFLHTTTTIIAMVFHI